MKSGWEEGPQLKPPCETSALKSFTYDLYCDETKMWWSVIIDHWSLIIIIVISTSEPCLPSAPPQQWSPEHQDLYDQHHEIIFMKSQDNDHPDHSIRNHHDHDHYLDHHHLGPGLPGRLSLRSHCSLKLNRKAHVFSDQEEESQDYDDHESWLGLSWVMIMMIRMIWLLWFIVRRTIIIPSWRWSCYK